MGKRSKRDFNKFEKRQTTKRGAKERARRELMNILDSISVSYDDNLKLHTAYDSGRRRASSAPRSEEILAEGVFELSKSGYGFVRLEGGERDIFVPAGKTLGALDGDLVSVSYKKYTAYTGDERTEGRVRKIIKIGKETLTGTLIAEQMRVGRGYRRVFFVEPDDRSFRTSLIYLFLSIFIKRRSIESVSYFLILVQEGMRSHHGGSSGGSETHKGYIHLAIMQNLIRRKDKFSCAIITEIGTDYRSLQTIPQLE